MNRLQNVLDSYASEGFREIRGEVVQIHLNRLKTIEEKNEFLAFVKKGHSEHRIEEGV